MAPAATTAAPEKMEVDEPKKEVPAEVPIDLNAIAVMDLKEHCNLIDRGEQHLIGRVLQVLNQTRKTINTEVLYKVIASCTMYSDNYRDSLLKFIGHISPPSAATTEQLKTPQPKAAPATPSRPGQPARRSVISLESEMYLHLLIALHLIDHGKATESIVCLNNLISKATAYNDRRTTDPIVAKGFFYLALMRERTGDLKDLVTLLSSHLRTATLRKHNETQATLIYTLLRCYMIKKQYQAAAKLVSKVTFPEGASNNDLARFLYYQGRIRALQLDYTAAAGYFLQAMRKAPQEAAVGFKQNTQKWIVVVGLLQGEIPERSIFRQPIYRKCLAPYLELTQAVRLGDLVKFNDVLTQYGPVFEKDETLTLIVRLRQNVIKTAVKQISLAYSRITIKDIAKKLQMNSEVETEYMVAKAIADGAIDAVITCDTKEGERFMRSSETADVYRTTEPQTHFDSRIRYCLELHNQAVKALRFPPKNKIEVETIESQREREQQELEFAKEMADDDDDDF